MKLPASFTLIGRGREPLFRLFSKELRLTGDNLAVMKELVVLREYSDQEPKACYIEIYCKHHLKLLLKSEFH